MVTLLTCFVLVFLATIKSKYRENILELNFKYVVLSISKRTFACSNLTMEILEQYVKSIQI